jgi:hypothetical protein
LKSLVIIVMCATTPASITTQANLRIRPSEADATSRRFLCKCTRQSQLYFLNLRGGSSAGNSPFASSVIPDPVDDNVPESQDHNPLFHELLAKRARLMREVRNCFQAQNMVQSCIIFKWGAFKHYILLEVLLLTDVWPYDVTLTWSNRSTSLQSADLRSQRR